MSKSPELNYSFSQRSLELAASISNNLTKFQSIINRNPNINLSKNLEIKARKNPMKSQRYIDLSRKEYTKLEQANTEQAYNLADEFKVEQFDDLIRAHKVLMTGLIKTSGELRSHEMKIQRNGIVTFIAPRHELVRPLIDELLASYKVDQNSLLIKACAFYVQLLYIHPFTDGNGRIAKLWLTKMLELYHPLLWFLPLDSLISSNKNELCNRLDEAHIENNYKPAIEFLLGLIDSSLHSTLNALTR